MLVLRDVDVVVVGYGFSGAAVAIEAASAGARVLALSRGRVEAERESVARAAGIEVRAGSIVHELVVEGGRVTGVGYTLPVASAAAFGGDAYPDGSNRRTPAGADPDGSAGAPMAMWSEATIVEAATCSSVVLALDARHWGFVGSAVWSAVRAREAMLPASRLCKSTQLALVVPESAGPQSQDPEPELVVRQWCARNEAGRFAAASQRALCVDEGTGVVMVGGNQRIPGLYSVVSARPRSERRDPASVVATARRVGRAVARRSAADNVQLSIR